MVQHTAYEILHMLHTNTCYMIQEGMVGGMPSSEVEQRHSMVAKGVTMADV